MTNFLPLRVPFVPLKCPININGCMLFDGCKMIIEGKGSVMAVPDEALAVMGVVTENMQLETAQRENAQIMSNVIETLMQLGVKREDVKTQTYQIQPQYDYVNGEQVFKGYRVIHEIKVEIKNINMIGKIIDEAVKAGANTVNDISFSVSNPKIYYEMALNESLSDAIAKAESIGRKFNAAVNPIPVKITEKTLPDVAPVPYMTMQATGASTPIQPGMVEITAIVESIFSYSCNRSY